MRGTSIERLGAKRGAASLACCIGRVARLKSFGHVEAAVGAPGLCQHTERDGLDAANVLIHRLLADGHIRPAHAADQHRS